MNSSFAMLNQRLWVGAVIALFLALVIVVGNSAMVAVLFGIAALAIGWEWGRLIYASHRWIYLTLMLLAVLFAAVWFLSSSQMDWLIYAALFWWSLMFLLVAAYRVEWLHTTWLGWVFRVGQVLVILAAWVAALELHRMDHRLLLYLVALVGVVDTSAYYCGRRWGKRKLIPELSPGKSQAGLWGALAGALLLAVIVAWFADGTWLSSLYFVLLSLFAALVCIVGDFAESMLKRRGGVKDSGVWLPGHGGVFDRADSFLAAAPWFFLFAPSHFG